MGCKNSKAIGTCGLKGCEDNIYNNEFCKKHTCDKYGCGNLTLYDFCLTHECRIKNCHKKSWMRLWCREHTCDVNECGSNIYTCANHRCAVKECTARKVSNKRTDYCETHACIRYICGAKRRSDLPVCENHKCVINDCKNDSYSAIQMDCKYCDIHDDIYDGGFDPAK